MLAASVVVHALVLYFMVDDPGRTPYVQVDKPVAKDTTKTAKTTLRPFNPTCVADVMLTAGARAALCMTPMRDKPLSCLGDVRERVSIDLLACNDTTPPPSVALLDNKTSLKKLKPMPLLPLLKKAKQKAFEKKQAKKVQKKFVALKKKELVKPKAAKIVEITKPDVEIKPKTARHVADFDSRVKEETVARGSTEKMVSQPGPKELKSAEKTTKKVPKVKPDKTAIKGKANEPKVVAKTDNDPDKLKSVETKAPTKKTPGMLSMRDTRKFAEKMKLTPGPKTGVKGRVTPNGIVPRKGNGPRRVAARTEDPARKGTEAVGKAGARKRIPNLLPSKELLRRVVGGGSVDKLDGVKSGKITALNARKWKFASFFNRLKRQVAQNWHPGQVYQRRDPQGNVYGTKDRITVLRVELHKDGSIKDLIVQKASGVGFLDDEAARAFRAAGPFPNPPPGLLGNKKLITFSFGFYFQIGSRRDSWKIFRYR